LAINQPTRRHTALPIQSYYIYKEGGGYQVACEVLILKSVTLECADQVTDQVGD